MRPSQNFQALVMAYDPFTPDAESRDAFVLQSMLLAEEARPLVPYVRHLLAGEDPRAAATQHRFDALLSLVHDAGREQVEASPLPAAIAAGRSRRAIAAAFDDVPVCLGMLRPELTAQLIKYRMPLMSRRRYEAELFFGHPRFAVGPQLPPDYRARCRAAADHPGDPAYPPPPHRIFTPYVLHPFYLFLQRR